MVVYIALDASLPGPRMRIRPLDGPERFVTQAADGRNRFVYVGTRTEAL